MSVTPEQLGAEIERIEKAIGAVHLGLQAAIVKDTIEWLAPQLPVLTGAYRASHTVGVGVAGSGPGVVIYEGPDRVPDDLVVPEEPQGRFGYVDGDDASNAVRERAKPYQRLEIRNGRFYADQVEQRYALYAQAEEVAQSSAERQTAVRIIFS